MSIFLVFHSFHPSSSILHTDSMDIHNYATKVNLIGRSRDGNYVSKSRITKYLKNLRNSKKKNYEKK